ncbi:hypothetical protein DM860_007008 [Cuscuta australis]|uniref:NADAR domain-containing protein n=1 Tax=Cuscuta australis TaxID=267555 RepID=A0A328E7A1_9ASTE|nr:hypothetical protein DM860_007008 [Cuscuta australis]
MYEPLKCKFTTNHQLKSLLVATEVSDLVEASPHDRFWGPGRNGKCQNELGELLIKVRSELLDHGSPVPPENSADHHQPLENKLIGQLYLGNSLSRNEESNNPRSSRGQLSALQQCVALMLGIGDLEGYLRSPINIPSHHVGGPILIANSITGTSGTTMVEDIMFGLLICTSVQDNVLDLIKFLALDLAIIFKVTISTDQLVTILVNL